MFEVAEFSFYCRYLQITDIADACKFIITFLALSLYLDVLRFSLTTVSTHFHDTLDLHLGLVAYFLVLQLVFDIYLTVSSIHLLPI